MQESVSHPEFLGSVAGRIELGVNFNSVLRECHIELEGFT